VYGGMAATTTPLLTALLKKATLDDHDELLKASNAALVKNKSDIEAQRVKTIALIKLDRYQEAVSFVEERGQSLREKVSLEHAYSLYKVGRLEEAADAAKSAGTRGAQHLEAQARYRLEDPEATSQVYAEIRKQHVGSEEFDLKVNQSAVDAQGQWLGVVDASTVNKPARDDLDNFETAYNAACGSIARGELPQAEILLKRAKELCKHNDDLTEEQKQEELLPIVVQQLYLLLALGKDAEAQELGKEISIDAVTDLSTRAVAQSNLLLTSGSQNNPFLTHKTFNSTPRIPESDRLFSYQSVPHASNRRTIDLQALKFNGMKSSTQSAAEKAMSPDTLLSSVFSAAAAAKNEVSKAAIHKVLPELTKRPTDVGLVMTIVQMYVLTNNIPAATDLMDTFFKRLGDLPSESEAALRHNPGLVAILISLYQTQGRRSAIKQELAKAASYWLDKPKAPSALLRAAGSALLETSEPEDTKLAADIFIKLRQQQPADKAAIAGFVASHAPTDAGATSADVDKLSSIEDLTSSVDVNALENDGIARPANALAQLTKSRKRAAPDAASTKPKRVRKSRLPKDYDPEKKADPERWLPMKDRSYYRPPKGKKKGKKGGDDRTQGGAVNESLNIDAKPAGGAAQGSGSGGGGGKKKGKKR
jgi:signal recognition particle subunit SRP72